MAVFPVTCRWFAENDFLFSARHRKKKYRFALSFFCEVLIAGDFLFFIRRVVTNQKRLRFFRFVTRQGMFILFRILAAIQIKVLLKIE